MHFANLGTPESQLVPDQLASRDMKIEISAQDNMLRGSSIIGFLQDIQRMDQYGAETS